MRKLVALWLWLGAAVADQGAPVYQAVGAIPVAGAACKGSRVQVDPLTGRHYACAAGVWSVMPPYLVDVTVESGTIQYVGAGPTLSWNSNDPAGSNKCVYPPANARPGDLLVSLCSVGLLASSQGWELLDGVNLSISWRRFQAGDTCWLPTDNNAVIQCRIAGFRGVIATGSPLDTQALGISSTGLVSAPAVTTVTAGAMVVWTGNARVGWNYEDPQAWGTAFAVNARIGSTGGDLRSKGSMGLSYAARPSPGPVTSYGPVVKSQIGTAAQASTLVLRPASVSTTYKVVSEALFALDAAHAQSTSKLDNDPPNCTTGQTPAGIDALGGAQGCAVPIVSVPVEVAVAPSVACDAASVGQIRAARAVATDGGVFICLQRADDSYAWRALSLTP